MNPPRPHPTAEPDTLVVLALRAIAQSTAARRLALHLGPALFRDQAARMLAGCLITGTPLPSAPGPALRAALARLVHEVRLTSAVPGDQPEYCCHLVRVLAEREHLAILAQMLRWAHGAVLERLPLAFILRRIVIAFAAAMGTRPLDAALHPGGRREWTP